MTEKLEYCDECFPDKEKSKKKNDKPYSKMLILIYPIFFNFKSIRKEIKNWKEEVNEQVENLQILPTISGIEKCRKKKLSPLLSPLSSSLSSSSSSLPPLIIITINSSIYYHHYHYNLNIHFSFIFIVTYLSIGWFKKILQIKVFKYLFI
ncbi:hypothetical protein LOAG_09224 [Loa loa]|uniref:Uncharacterized protein n=1 Tax=Loa loa TaxID=7209 RepID=A0A1S0TSA9_LOALO|nr:hypothetical protein LOAG_09224 [Loa loa]EFO19269.1 hypothetical protein LOAG_09224 [Loa loa]